ncbi:MAG TPA: YceI family protein [Pyrinomonadaceae bacterium]|jgi:polyisoprenoid-binding protein YceI|nr:YceI family protein [Pyrinomonadaceae bacterium]
MRGLRDAFLVAALTALVALAFVGSGLGSRMAHAQDKAAKVSYAPIPGGEYKIDPAHSIIGFAIRHLEINWIEGRFKDFTGTVRYDDTDVTRSTVEFSAKVESIDTGIEPRNAHLKTADFFDVEKYPSMTFKSTRVERKSKDSYILYGDLTLKGVTKQVSLPFTVTGAVKDPWGNTRFGIEAHTKINRRDYGINYGNALQSGGFDVGNEVSIDLNLEAMKPGPKPAGQ